MMMMFIFLIVHIRGHKFSDALVLSGGIDDETGEVMMMMMMIMMMIVIIFMMACALRSSPSQSLSIEG
jgi:hypothetical protein